MNVKLAMIACTLSIAGMSWIVQKFDTPRTTVTSPLVVGTNPWGYAPIAGVDMQSRSELARQFERPNALERQAEVNRSSLSALAYYPAGDSAAEHGAAPLLPPLVYEIPPLYAVAPVDDAPGEQLSPPPALASADGFAETDSQLPLPPPAKRYLVVKGDTLTRIARREWASTDARLIELLKSTNPQLAQRGGRVLLGEELAIPDTATAQRVLAGDAVTPGGFGTPPETPPTTADAQWYTIRRSDTLASIAKRFLNDSRRWREIVSLNGTLDPQRIVPGTRIKLPPGSRAGNG